MPSVKRGNYPAVVLIENNPKVVEDGHKPTWQEGELLAITIKSMHLNNEDDFTFEVIVDSKQGGVVYINGGGSASLDLGDYMTLDILLEDIDR